MEIEPATNGASDKKCRRYCLKQAIQASFGVPDNPDYIFDIAPSYDHSTMAVSLSTNAIKLYSPVKGKAVGECIGHSKTITQILYPDPMSPHMLCSSSADGTIRTWDARTTKQVGVLQGSSKSQEFWSLDVGGPSGNLFVAGSKAQITMWDWRTKKQVTCLEDCHTEDVTQVLFHPNNREKVFSASVDGLICVLNTLNGTDDDDILESVISVGTSVAKVGFFGASFSKLWCLTHVETLSIWDIEEEKLVADFGDTRQRASMNWPLSPVNYLIDCHYSSSLDDLWLVAGTLGGSVGFFPIDYGASHDGAVSTGNIGPVCSVLEGGHLTTVRSVKTFNSDQDLFCWTGGEDGRLCSWSRERNAVDTKAWVSGNLAMKREKHMKQRHNPY